MKGAHDRGGARDARRSTRWLDRARPDDGVAARGTPLAPARSARRVRQGRHEPLREPGPVLDPVDLGRYPRDEERDLALAQDAGVDVVFAPSSEEMYPPGFQTWVEVTELGSILEGRFRTGHFRGVATIVLKLFSIVRPHRAYFGQKDAQQVEVVRRLIRDLALEIELRVLPTVRDADGLALSSRNALLTPEERLRALALSRALATRDPRAAREALAESNGVEVDYVERADFDPPVLAGAIRVGPTRLIDNVPLEGET